MAKRRWLELLLVTGAVAVALMWLGRPRPPEPPEPIAAATVQPPSPAPYASGIMPPGWSLDAARVKPGRVDILTLLVGKGPVARSGDVVSVHYTGWLADGTKFDSSLDRDEPFAFRLGGGDLEVIPGWELGVPGMRVGELRRLIVPPDLGYGEQGVGYIPPESTLIFEVELLDLVPDEAP